MVSVPVLFAAGGEIVGLGLALTASAIGFGRVPGSEVTTEQDCGDHYGDVGDLVPEWLLPCRDDHEDDAD